MIDLHCHLLPGVDDGSRSVEQSVRVLQTMAVAGITDVVLTPHLDASRISEGPPPAHDEAFAQLSMAAPPGVRLHRGAEVMLDRSLTPRAVATRRVTLAHSRYILVEFTRLVAEPMANQALSQVVREGLVPLLAHPERYSICSPALVASWRAMGVAIQVDANTVFMPTGRGARARALLAEGLADVLAADNHGDRRSLAEPFKALGALGGSTAAEFLMVRNPAAVLADQPLEPVPSFEVKVSLYQRIKGWVDEMGQ